MLHRMHAYGNAASVRDHPEGRARMWDLRGLRKKRIKDFEMVYTGFEKLLETMHLFEGIVIILSKKYD